MDRIPNEGRPAGQTREGKAEEREAEGKSGRGGDGEEKERTGGMGPISVIDSNLTSRRWGSGSITEGGNALSTMLRNWMQRWGMASHNVK